MPTIKPVSVATQTKWEYAGIQADANFGGEMSANAKLTEWGRDGWELCAVLPLNDRWFKWIFKRAIVG